MRSRHFVESEICTIYCNVYGAFSQSLKPKEHLRTYGIEELMAACVSKDSYREGTYLLNRFLHREGEHSFKVKTCADHMVSIGNRLKEQYDSISTQVLAENGFTDDGRTAPADLSDLAPPAGAFSDADPMGFFKERIDEFNTGLPEEMKIKDKELIGKTETDPGECIYISLDDVGVKHQKDTRKGGGTKEGKNVENTVIRIKSGEQHYTITAVGMDQALKQLLSFLIFNQQLQTKKLCFFSDGATNIKAGLERYFGSFSYQLRLDWYHLELHLDQALSMALWKGYRDALQPVIMSMLWAGNVKDAINFLEALKNNKKAVKSQSRLRGAIDYLKRKQPYVDCYGLRKNSHYVNSSNSAEKENDLVVAQRQKHNGMAWSFEGSGSLAVITACQRNGEYETWMRTGKLGFGFSAQA